MSNNKKDVKALILSGGGVKGTFQYGAVDYIYNHVLEKEKIQNCVRGFCWSFDRFNHCSR